ncbi:MAG: DUF1214 domain-containing protein [Pseudomonadota bacterium]
MNLIANVFVFIVLSLLVGLGSAWLMVERGTTFSSVTAGPWKTWTNIGLATADPYTRAHVTRSGGLPVMSKAVLYFRTLRDNEGSRIDSECDYEVRGSDGEAAWWSLAAYDGAGNLMENAAARYAFNANTVMRAPDGSWRILLSSEPSPGNWLPVDSDYQVELVYRMFRNPTGSRDEDITRTLPDIKRLRCR